MIQSLTHRVCWIKFQNIFVVQCYTFRNQEQIILVSVIKALKPYDKMVSLNIVYHMYIGSQWDMTVDFTLSLWQSWLNLWSLIICIFFCTTVYFLIIVLDSKTRQALIFIVSQFTVMFLVYDDMGKAATVLLFSIPTCSVHWFNIHYTCITKYMVLDHQKFEVTCLE